ncbi:uncharacterized protein LOC120335558 [Styela clava]
MEPYPPAFEDVPAIQIYRGKEVRKYGVVKKKSGGRKIPLIQSKYETRFVIISRGWVYYYKDKSSDKPQGKFSLQGFSNTVINAEEEQSSMPFVFKIYSKKANERTWFFSTENTSDMHEWMEAFRLEIEQYNVKGFSDIRHSQSCPNPIKKPHPHLEASNGRSHSVHDNAVPFPQRLKQQPHSNVSSCTNVTITSGIGSSTSSMTEQPDDLYEPFEPSGSDEWDSDPDSDYETPNFVSTSTAHHGNIAQHSAMIHSPTLTPKFQSPTSSVPHFTHTNRNIRSYSHTSPPTERSHEPFHFPQKSPMISPKHSFPRPHSVAVGEFGFNSLADELNKKMFPGRVSSQLQPPSRPISNIPKYSPPTHSPPALRQRADTKQNWTPRVTDMPKSSILPSRFSPKENLPIHSSTNPHHNRMRSEGVGGYGKQQNLSPEFKRHSMPCLTIQAQLNEQLSAKLGTDLKAPQPGPKPQRPKSIANTANEDNFQRPGGYRPLQSPSTKPLPPLPEPQDERNSFTEFHENPIDWPDRAPPLPPENKRSGWPVVTSPKDNVFSGQQYRPHDFNNAHGPPFAIDKTSHLSPNKTSHLSPMSPPKQFYSPPPQPGTIFPMPPALPSKPNSKFLYNNTSLSTGNQPASEQYDDNLLPEPEGPYDIPLEDDPDQSYESPYSDSDAITEIVYQDEEVVPMSQDRPGISPKPVPNSPGAAVFRGPVVPKVPALKPKVPIGKPSSASIESKSTVMSTSNKPDQNPVNSWKSNPRFPTSTTNSPQKTTLDIADGNKPAWLQTKLKPTQADTPTKVTPAWQQQEPVKGMSNPRSPPKTFLSQQKQANNSKWNHHSYEPNSKSTDNKGIPPPMPKTPKPNLTPKLKDFSHGVSKPPPPIKPKPDTKQMSGVAAMRERFNQ